METHENLVRELRLELANRDAQTALRERVKELTCLYGVARVAQQPGATMESSLQAVAELLPPAWQFPEVASARILFDGRAFTTPGYRAGAHRQSAEILVDGVPRGVIEVVYMRDRPEFMAGAFLKEEQNLIDTVAREVGLLIERREAEKHKSDLQTQLRHADRLATLGQLAAGVAHELNEPLGSMLGFAQLAMKNPRLPQGTAEDLRKIEAASLHAREVIRKLLLFARQMPPRKDLVNLNQIVEEGLYFLESRCARGEIEVVRSLASRLPEIEADPSQLHQVFVNLVVNAIQAMPNGGRLTIRTLARRGRVTLGVEDTGVGMSEEVRKKIFVPFFTTKDVDQGTGLGLSVVHGIVTSHGGSIRVDTQVGRGSRFEILLPAAWPRSQPRSD